MKLKLDQFIIEPKPDESLYDIVNSLGLVTGSLTTDPIAAKIAGRVFYAVSFALLFLLFLTQHS